MRDLVTTITALKNSQWDQTAALRLHISREFPLMMEAFRIIDEDYSQPKGRKGFNLVKRESKKYGFLYYVRYSHNGKMLPSKWNCHTALLEEAERFARDNRERLVGQYLRDHDGKGFSLFETFYREHSEYLASEEKRNRPLSDTTRRNYHSVITGKFIPFMRTHHISCYEHVDGKALDDFQDHYLALGIKPQTVNDYMKAVKRVFRYLERKRLVAENPCANLHNIPVSAEDKAMRGCYDLSEVKGVFNKRWRDHKLYLLCLLIYTTGMRNGEIAEIRINDMVSFGGCHFIDIKKSKTANGIRLVPLHERAYQKLKAFGAGKGPEEKLFKGCTSVTFSNANHELARIICSVNKKVDIGGITFYSGRHFWKTLMNSEGLGEDVEEIFMGHKVSGDVRKLYNHRDKQGKKLMVKKAKQVFSILDKRLFVPSGKNKKQAV
jgi:integrase